MISVTTTVAKTLSKLYGAETMITVNDVNAHMYVKLVRICEKVDGELKLFKDGTTQKWYLNAGEKSYSSNTLGGALSEAASEILGEL